jgi:hypothetical protein
MKLLISFIFLFPVFINAQSQNLKYSWRKISGPSQYRIVSPHSAHTSVTDLTVGVYQFELKVTNAKGLFALDTMKVTVNAPQQMGSRKVSAVAQLASK